MVDLLSDAVVGNDAIIGAEKQLGILDYFRISHLEYPLGISTICIAAPLRRGAGHDPSLGGGDQQLGDVYEVAWDNRFVFASTGIHTHVYCHL